MERWLRGCHGSITLIKSVIAAWRSSNVTSHFLVRRGTERSSSWSFCTVISVAPVTPATPNGNKYYILLIDDLSRQMWVMLLRTKDRAKGAFVVFQARAEAEAGRRLGILCTDRDREFTPRAFLDHCIKEGIQQHLTTLFSPKYNGVVER
jgi:hypothetical protein